MTALDVHGSKWNNIVIHERRTVFFLPCKAGQTSVKAAIGGDFDFATPDVIAKGFGGFRFVAVFRDPWNRLASGWHDKGRERRETFSSFVEWLLSQVPRRTNQHFRPQVENWTTENGKELPLDDVLRLETLADDWNRVWGGEIGHLNQTNGEAAGELLAQLQPWQVKRLKRFYANDFRFMESL